MRIMISECDTCGKRTSDRSSEIGWITLDDDGLTVSGGRTPTMANTLMFLPKIRAEEGGEVDYCSIKCMLKDIFTGFNYKDVKDMGDLIKMQDDMMNNEKIKMSVIKYLISVKSMID